MEVKYLFKSDITALCKIYADRERFEEYFKEPFVRGLICEEGSQNLGYIFWETIDGKVEILNIRVTEKRKGIGRFLISEMEEKPISRGDWNVDARVPETDLDTQLFFREVGYIGSDTKDGYYLFNKVI